VSQSWWEQNLKAGARVSTTIAQNDLAPEDLICHKVRELLVANATLLAIFSAERIEVVPARDMLEFRNLPRLQIYPFSTTESARPTQVAQQDIEVFIGIRYSARDVRPLIPWAPGVASVVHRIKQVLRDNRQLADFSSNAVAIHLASNSNAGAVSFIVDVNEEGEIAYTQELSWIYKAKTDDITGLLAPIADAGGD